MRPATMLWALLNPRPLIQGVNRLALWLLVVATLWTSSGQAIEPTQPQVGVQLWSVRKDLARDFEGTLQQLKAFGFEGVEFAGYFGPYAQDPRGLKALLDRLGLKVPAAHVPFDQFTPARFNDTVRFYQALDCALLIVPMDLRASTTAGALAVAHELTALESRLAPLGLHTGYHNHKVELLGMSGATPWDVIAQNTPASVVLQQDVAWTKSAGKNPVDVVRRYPGRTVVTHYKAAAPEPGNREPALIGQDSTDWPALIVANRSVGGTRWLVVEQELYPDGMTPLQSVEASLKGLQKIVAELDRKR